MNDKNATVGTIVDLRDMIASFSLVRFIGNSTMRHKRKMMSNGQLPCHLM
jgi:hypothetical protein